MKRILIAVKNLNDQGLLTHYINKYFVCELLYATNGEDALRLTIDYNPDVIIAEANLNIYENLSLIEYLNTSFTVPVIAITGVNEKKFVRKLFSLGIVSYIAKPINSYKLFENIESVFMAA